MRRNPNFMRDNPHMAQDPLSDVLTLVNAQSVVTGGLFASGSWSLRFRPRLVKFYAVVKGGCFLQREGEPAPRRLEKGDALLVADRTPFVMASDLTLEPTEARAFFENTKDNFGTIGVGDEFSLLAGHLSLNPDRGAFLIAELPPIIHLHGESSEAIAVQQLLGQLYAELRSGQAGGSLAASMLTQLVFLYALRAHLAQSGPIPAGWLRAMGDPRIAPALRLIHGDPSHPWTLEELAKAACMSRSAFALHFKTAAGVAPLTYLMNWRMRLAERSLREGDTSVASLAYSLGYTSESAFSNAFKRVTGVAPKHFRGRKRGPVLVGGE